MKRILLLAAFAIAALSFDMRPAPAAEMPWCAIISMTDDGVYEDCQYRTFEECWPNVIAGNRGFCNHNPRYVGPEVRPARPRAHKKRRAKPQ